MINEEKLKEILAQYKKDLPGEWWQSENYKWAAVKHFQDNWDIDAPNFADMLDESLKLSGNLLTSKRYLAKGMIVDMAKAYPQEVKDMFAGLFDESVDIADRMIEFKNQADLLAKSLVGDSKNSYQDLRAISVYLWLRYPDRHYIYKYSELRKISEVLRCDFNFTKSTMADKIRRYVDLYNQINQVVRRDASLVQIEKELTGRGDFYWSPESCIMAGDVGFYISRHNTVNAPTQTPQPEFNSKPTSYTKQDFLNDVFMDDVEYDRLITLLERKKNLILQGAPGVGKTFTAKRLAWSIIGSKSKEQIKMIQFHQSYSYEDFVMGYRPNAAGGFELRKGVFYEFCEQAVANPNSKYFFIIDEINRGNLSKIFGELLMLIEGDYRGSNNAISLAYATGEDADGDNHDVFKSGRNFYIPNNIYIIGMMNTADRSLAMMDYALRRRFAFYTIGPKFDSAGFKKHQAKLNNDHFNKLISSIENLNNNIVNDPTLGNGFQIGHSYFCNLFDTGCTDTKLENIVNFEIAPMLREYWFDNEDKANGEIDKLKQIFQHAE